MILSLGNLDRIVALWFFASLEGSKKGVTVDTSNLHVNEEHFVSHVATFAPL